MIHIKRVHDPVETADGTRVLVDRLWPRGMKKSALAMDLWDKEAAPSDSLRRWFHHDPKKWPEFQRLYAAELEGKPTAWTPLLEAARDGDVTLLYGAHDTEHNNAVVLRKFLERKLNGDLAPAGSAAAAADPRQEAA